MKVAVIGLGVQGAKRVAAAGPDVVATVDALRPEAQFRAITAVPLDAYEAALVCTPDAAKLEIVTYLLAHGKHVLVEKPLLAPEHELEELAGLAKRHGVVCYTAYNHRFEPHFVRMKALLSSGALGRVYRCRMFYGNGTARLVRDSAWRDSGAGVLPDLGSHLLDTALFWFDGLGEDFRVISSRCFETRAPDHVVIGTGTGKPQLEFEMTLLSWRNHFTCDVYAEKGSAHIRSLCKWGPSTFTLRTRVLPSGRPPEESVTLVQADPTWDLEYAHFRLLCEDAATTDLGRDLALQRMLRRLGDDAIELAKR